MAAPYSGYTPPNSYGMQPGMNGYTPSYMPYQQRADLMQQQYQQPYQVQPAPMPQQMQQQPMQTQPQPVQASENLIVVGTIDEARSYLPDMSGNRQIFSIAADPDTLAVKSFNLSDGSTSFTLYAKSNEQPEPNKMQKNEAQNQPVSIENEPLGTITQEDIKPLENKITGLEENCSKIMRKFEDLEELINDKLSKLSADDGAKQSTGGTVDAAGKSDDANGGEPASDPKQSNTAKSRKSNAPSNKGEEPTGN